MEETKEPFVSVDRVAAHFDVHPQTVRSWVRKGLIPKTAYVKVGQQTLRFRISIIEAALMDNGGGDSDEDRKPEQLSLDFEQNGE